MCMCNIFQKKIKLNSSNQQSYMYMIGSTSNNSVKMKKKFPKISLKTKDSVVIHLNKTRHHVNLQARSFSPRTLRSFLVFFLCNLHSPPFGTPCSFLQFPATVDTSSTHTSNKYMYRTDNYVPKRVLRGTK